MNMPGTLERCFVTYLQTDMSQQAGRQLVSALQHSGFAVHARALEHYMRAGTSSYFEETVGATCFVGPHLPSSARSGALWLDTVELSLMVLVPDPDDPQMQAPRHAVLPAWIALHPVHVWQFRAFARCVRLGRKRTEFPAPADYMHLARFAEQEERRSACGMYHDEALAYAHWFGKYLGDQMQYEAARAFLPADAFARALPPSLHLWDESEVSETEFLRIAFSASTLDNEYQHELDLREIGSHIDPANRLLFDEWKTTPHMAFACTGALALGLSASPMPSTLFFDLNNTSPRPRGV